MSGELTSRAAPFRMRPRRLVVADPLLPRVVPVAAEATIVGGGIAGMSAAVVLAERGVAVTVLEAAEHLGGRLGAWPERLPDGSYLSRLYASPKLDFPPGAGGFANEPRYPRREGW